MILTPEERRAVLALLALLLFGQAAALWQEHRRSRPDRELSQWLTTLAAARCDSASEARTDSVLAAAAAAALLAPHAGQGRDGPAGPGAPGQGAGDGEIPSGTLEDAPPGVLETGRIRVNLATAEHLRLLPGIGPVLAGRIVEDREANGPFRTPEDLLRVSGIGPRKLEGLRGEIDLALDGDSVPARLMP